MNKKELKNKKSTKNCSNLISNHQLLISDHNAITLIALVITIIVMLILVGVTVAIALNGGLFSTAKKASVDYRAGTIQDEVTVWKGTKEVAKYSGESVQTRDELIDDQLMRGLLTQEEADTAKKDGRVQIGSKLIEYGEPEQDSSLKIELKVVEAEVTEDTIPVEVIALNDGEEAQNLTYTYFLQEEGSGENQIAENTDNTYTFTSLDKTKDYTVRVMAESASGEKDEDVVTIKALIIKYITEYDYDDVFSLVYTRYKDGMTWEDWVNSGFKHELDSDTSLSVVTGKVTGFGRQLGRQCYFCGCYWNS